MLTTLKANENRMIGFIVGVLLTHPTLKQTINLTGTNKWRLMVMELIKED
jgi:hypothetical protein